MKHNFPFLSRITSPHKSKKLAIKRIAFFSYLATFILILGIAYQNRVPHFVNKIPYRDKVAHFLLYGIATYLGHHALEKRKRKFFYWKIPFWPLIFGLFTVTEECLQLFYPHRSFCIWDTCASILGLLLGYWLAEKF